MADDDSIPRLSTRLGFTPAVYTRFYAFPLSAGHRQSVIEFLGDVRANGGIAVLTLEPFAGLPAVTAPECDDLAAICAEAETQGIGGIMIRFAHEMNGHWYPWGQKPALYRQTFQLLANTIHSRTLRTAMLWSPNNGVGYPYGSGLHSAAQGSPDFHELDTNHDGVLTQGDDMFGPFYPGDSYVDWVGLTIYHWGSTYPWLENETPTPGEFASVMDAAGPGSPADYSRWFYARYCADSVHRKPMTIAETSALYNTEQPGANELAIKRGWFRQIYNVGSDPLAGPDIATTFPKLKCISWFDHYKREGEAQNQFIDWRATSNSLVRAEFVTALNAMRSGQRYFLSAQDFAMLRAPNGLTAVELPAILPLNGTVSVTMNVRAQAACDLEVDLLDQDDVFQGGTRLSVPAGTSVAHASFPLIQSLKDGSKYRWSIFLTPTGGSYLDTLARYNGPHPVARAVQSAVMIQATPTTVAPGASFNARVKYTAASSATLAVRLLNSANEIAGTGSLAISKGDGLVDVTVTQGPANVPGNYSLQATVNDVQSIARAVTLTNISSSDSVSLAVEPGMVSAGDVFRFAVSYSAMSARNLRLELTNSTGSVVGTAVQPLVAGSAVADLTISHPSASFGTYTAKVHIVPPGGTSSQALASSAPTAVHVVSLAYSHWTLDRWGVVLGNDPVLAMLDPDGDGAANQDEYVALTDPRDAASRFNANFSMNGVTVSVTWPSTIGRNYQLLSSPSPLGAWTPVGGVVQGNGGTMQYQSSSGAGGSQRFYRVQVSVP
jgi:hypothetical protein